MEQLGLPAATMRKRVEETLDLLGIAELRDVPLRELSRRAAAAGRHRVGAHRPPAGPRARRADLGARPHRRPRRCSPRSPGSCTTSGSPSSWPSTGSSGWCSTPTRVVHVSPNGEVRSGLPSDLMVDSDIAPPVVELGRYAGWSPLPLSVRDARRAAAAAARPPPGHPCPGARSTVGRRSHAADAGAAGRRRGRSATDVVVRYPGDVLAVAEVDLDLRPGEVIALMGRNGCGKSSLLWALQGSGILTSGTVRATRRRPAARRRHGIRDRRAAQPRCRRASFAGRTGAPDRRRPALPRHRRRRVRPGRPRERRAERHLREPPRGGGPRHPRASSTRATCPRARSWRSCSPCS